MESEHGIFSLYAKQEGLTITEAMDSSGHMSYLTPTPLPASQDISCQIHPLQGQRGSHLFESSRDSDGHPSLSGEGTRMRSIG